MVQPYLLLDKGKSTATGNQKTLIGIKNTTVYKKHKNNVNSIEFSTSHNKKTILTIIKLLIFKYLDEDSILSYEKEIIKERIETTEEFLKNKKVPAKIEKCREKIKKDLELINTPINKDIHTFSTSLERVREIKNKFIS